MKNKLVVLIPIFLFLSFTPMDNDKVFHLLTNKSENIVKAKIVEQRRFVRMEDGIEECTFSFKVLKVYKGESIKIESNIQITIMSYSLNTGIPSVGEELILFLSKDKKKDSFKLVDNWLGVQKYSEPAENWLLEHISKK
jgi:hypothetical protein